MVVGTALCQLQASGNQQEHMIERLMPGKNGKAARVVLFLGTGDDRNAIAHRNVGERL